MRAATRQKPTARGETWWAGSRRATRGGVGRCCLGHGPEFSTPVRGAQPPTVQVSSLVGPRAVAVWRRYVEKPVAASEGVHLGHRAGPVDQHQVVPAVAVVVGGGHRPGGGVDGGRGGEGLRQVGREAGLRVEHVHRGAAVGLQVDEVEVVAAVEVVVAGGDLPPLRVEARRRRRRRPPARSGSRSRSRARSRRAARSRRGRAPTGRRDRCRRSRRRRTVPSRASCRAARSWRGSGTSAGRPSRRAP